MIAESTSFQLSYNHNILQMRVLLGHYSQLHPPSSHRYNLLLKSDIIRRKYHSQFHVLVLLLLSKQLKFNQNIMKTRPPTTRADYYQDLLDMCFDNDTDLATWLSPVSLVQMWYTLIKSHSFPKVLDLEILSCSSLNILTDYNCSLQIILIFICSSRKKHVKIM